MGIAAAALLISSSDAARLGDMDLTHDAPVEAAVAPHAFPAADATAMRQDALAEDPEKKKKKKKEEDDDSLAEDPEKKKKKKKEEDDEDSLAQDPEKKKKKKKEEDDDSLAAL